MRGERLDKGPNNYLRRTKLDALGQTGGKKAAPYFLTVLDGPAPWVRTDVIYRLGHIPDESAIVPSETYTYVFKVVLAPLGNLRSGASVETSGTIEVE